VTEPRPREDPIDSTRVVAVVPTFHPEPAVRERMRLLRAQTDGLVVVDDGSGPVADALLAELEADGHRVIRHERNSGIAAALNTGMAAAFADGAGFVLTLDQDTVLGDGYVAACLDVFARARPETRLAVVCADVINGAPSIPAERTPEGFGIVREAIQSGMVIPRAAIEAVGDLDARLFIDLVDTEFCLRARAAGWLSVVADGTSIDHELGERVPVTFFGRPRFEADGSPRTYEYHSPLRRYYIMRNTVDLVLRWLRREPRWAASFVRRQINDLRLAITAGPHRGRQFLAELVGALHGLVRHRGPAGPTLRRMLAPTRR
jgi:rhamnosyltransferase